MNASSEFSTSKEAENASRAPQRITITVPARTLEKLIKRSHAEGRSLSNLAAFLLEQSLESDP